MTITITQKPDLFSAWGWQGVKGTASLEQGEFLFSMAVDIDRAARSVRVGSANLYNTDGKQYGYAVTAQKSGPGYATDKFGTGYITEAALDKVFDQIESAVIDAIKQAIAAATVAFDSSLDG